MKSSKSSPSLFEIPNTKNAKVIKNRKKLFLHNIVYNYTQPLSFENEPYSLETIPLIREHLDTYLFYIYSYLIYIRYIHNFEVEDIERIVITQDNPHHWLQTDIIRIQSFLDHYFKDITLNE